ncbi:glycerol-3-phosphate 1-O-acyltransferase PlsY [Spiroplasma endosymbiont of Stenodema calcarata]|uniref:glycerol-3-phosphate 1-O-acyltransferase PlsY n=1 Tax=Spiroplasma endosymbiont of Stenodema calcarata TaxID=3139328 RepID=UPI003CCB3B94
MTLYGYLGTVLVAIIGYLIGSFSWSIFISKTIYKIDVREYHSKNAGATNTSRVLGKKWGFAIMFLDMLKVTITMAIAFAISCIDINGVNFGSTSYYIPGLCVLIGHSYPIYYKFKGGKTVSSFLGLLWMTNPYYFLIAAVVWWSTFFIWKRVSVSSILGAIFVGTLCWIPQLSGIQVINFNGDLLKDSHVVWMNYFHYVNYNNYYDSLALINIIITLSAIFLIFKHHQNIARLFKGTEKQYDFKGKSDLAAGNISPPIKSNPIKKT